MFYVILKELLYLKSATFCIDKDLRLNIKGPTTSGLVSSNRMIYGRLLCAERCNLTICKLFLLHKTADVIFWSCKKLQSSPVHKAQGWNLLLNVHDLWALSYTTTTTNKVIISSHDNCVFCCEFSFFGTFIYFQFKAKYCPEQMKKKNLAF